MIKILWIFPFMHVSFHNIFFISPFFLSPFKWLRQKKCIDTLKKFPFPYEAIHDWTFFSLSFSIYSSIVDLNKVSYSFTFSAMYLSTTIFQHQRQPNLFLCESIPHIYVTTSLHFTRNKWIIKAFTCLFTFLVRSHHDALCCTFSSGIN